MDLSSALPAPSSAHLPTRAWGGLHAIGAATLAVLSGCASLPSPTPESTSVPTQWQASQPHGGSTAQLSAWWSQFDDPLLPQLVQRAEQRHPTLAQASARIRQARAAAVAAGASAWPELQASAGVVRSHTGLPPSPGTATSGSLGVDASWEIDLFGGQAQTRRGAQARALGSEAQWHDARVSLAAEVAATYVGLRACEALVELNAQDAASLAQTAALLQKKIKAGLDAPAQGSLAEASAADAAQRTLAQRAECDLSVKALVALTQDPEPALRQDLTARRGLLPQPVAFELPSVPTALLAQRPDLAAAERALVAAAADVGVADADRWPRLSLRGAIGLGQVRSGGQTFDGSTWSIGPSLVAPLLDAGRRKAGADAARARYDEAQAAWQGRALQAVREVEEALVRLDAADRRQADAERAAQAYASFFKATETQWRVGTGNLLDLEQARRTQLASQSTLIQLQRERVAAWVALYKSAGGGWRPDSALPASASRTDLAASPAAQR